MLNRITKGETTLSSLAFAKPFVSGSAFMVYSVAQLKIFARLFFVFEAAEQLPTKEAKL